VTTATPANTQKKISGREKRYLIVVEISGWDREFIRAFIRDYLTGDLDSQKRTEG
jgi:hypothetical protein